MDDDEYRVKQERVVAGVRPGTCYDVTDADPDGWAADLIAVLDERKRRRDARD